MTLKFRNIPTEVDGLKFSSRREAKRYGELKLLERAGQIKSLKTQPRYPLIVSGETVAHYVGDFSYVETSTGLQIIEDVKSPVTRKHPVYRLKAKMMRAMGLNVVEV